MKLKGILLALIPPLSATLASASVLYVDLNSTNPVPPYSNWNTAATNIQDAVDAANPGDKILVTDGVYSAGSRTAPDGGATRVTITNALVLQSVNGSAVTTIDGGGAVRCAYLASNSLLNGFTLTNGHAGNGGGVMCQSANAAILNCWISGNSASSVGGGAYSGSLNSCMIVSNSSQFSSGGGVALSTLNGCSLIGNSADETGGGAYSSSLVSCTITANRANAGGGADGCTLNNCVVVGNAAVGDVGGGAAGSYITNSVLSGNTAEWYGGGAIDCWLNHCTVTGNSARISGGGIYVDFGGSVSDSILFFNNSPAGANYFGVTPSYCCTTPLPSGGVNNLALDPQLASISHLSANSPCIGAANPQDTFGDDIDYQAWANKPAIGCDEFYPGLATGPLTVSIQTAYTNLAQGFALHLTAQIAGQARGSLWNFGDGTIVSNSPYATHSWTVPGDYVVALTAYNDSIPGGVHVNLPVHIVLQPTHYVDLNSTNPSAPYVSWATAATSIQDAVDAAETPGAMVLVADGIYQTGTRVVFGSMSNRVAVTKPLNLQSVNGPAVTTIRGYQVPGVGYGNGAVRCLYLTNGASATGFTLSNGGTRGSGDLNREQHGAGVWCESTDGSVSNCVITSNAAYWGGGGACFGRLENCNLNSNSTACLLTTGARGGGARGAVLNNCKVIGNSAQMGCGADFSSLSDCEVIGNFNNCGAPGVLGSGGGASASILISCAISANICGEGGGTYFCPLVADCLFNGNQAGEGGGTMYGYLTRCTLIGNSAGIGGGARYATLDNCVVFGNSATSTGGGSYSGTLRNCTVVGNSATNSGGGSSGDLLYNSIVYFNSAPNWPNYISGITLYCCTLPDSGPNNITNAPLFVDLANGNLRLQSNSPCLNAGNNTYAPPGPDLDGNPRIVGGTVDIGAYEFQHPTSVISYAWLEYYGFPIDGSADYADPDHDGMNNWQEWIAGTNPTNALSALRLLAPTSGGTNVVVTWQSVAGIDYSVERSSSVLGPFTPLAAGIVGQPGTTTFNDTNAVGRGPIFYRVRVYHL
jgi:hypothetical protein